METCCPEARRTCPGTEVFEEEHLRSGGGKPVKEPFLGKSKARSGVLEDKGNAVSRSCRIERDVDPAGLPYA